MNSTVMNSTVMNSTVMNSTVIPDEYYDFETYDLLYNTLTDDDIEYMQTKNEIMGEFLFKRWRMIINSFSANYYRQYYAQDTQSARNTWFKKYLDYPTKDFSQMPEIL